MATSFPVLGMLAIVCSALSDIFMFEKRILKFQGTQNVRDLGGYWTNNGSQVKWRQLYRGSRLSKLTQRDLRFLKRRKVAEIVDFRSAVERRNEPDIVPKGAKDIILTVLGRDTTHSTQSAEELAKASSQPDYGYHEMIRTYHRMIADDFSQKAYTKFFDLLLKKDPEQSLLFHCTEGKDRTGLATALFYTALGVDTDTIYKDYLLTNDILRERLDQRLEKASKYGASQADLDNIESFMSVDADYLSEAFSTMADLSGDPENYLAEYLHLDDSKIQILRNKYLV